MPRFVILWHKTPPGYPRAAHFDLMLECGETLRTWAMEKLPAHGETAIAERLPDHRLLYLDFEGEVQPQRGIVSRADAGQYDVDQDTAESLVVRLRGNKLRGILTLTLEDESAQRWRVALSAG